MPAKDSLLPPPTNAEIRKFLVDALAASRQDGTDEIIIPFSGALDLVRCAIDAGFTASQVRASDEDFASCLLGQLCGGKPLEDLPFKVHREVQLPSGQQFPLGELYDLQTTDVDRAAVLLLALSMVRIDADVKVQAMLLTDLVQRKENHLARIKSDLSKHVETYSGISFHYLDARKLLSEQKYTTSLAVVANRSQKFSGNKPRLEELIVTWPCPSRFDSDKDSLLLFEEAEKASLSQYWIRGKNSDGFENSNVFFSAQVSRDRFDFAVGTTPCAANQLASVGGVAFKKGHKSESYGLPVWGFQDELTEDSTVNFIRVEGTQALYYRDLWAHRLGQTASKVYFLIVVDSKIYGVVGFMTGDMYRHNSTVIFETFGFNAPSTRYRSFNRLLMMLITCTQMRDFLASTISRKNRLYTMNGLRTSCLQRYRDPSPINKGILPWVFRERLPSGLYRVVYETVWHEKTWRDCVKEYIDFEAAPKVKRKPGSGEIITEEPITTS